MNVYDFDKTIYRGDSTAGLVLYCFQKRPLCLLSLPRTGICGLLYLLGIMKKKTFKQNLFHMFAYIPDSREVIEAFIASHKDHIKEWYLRQQKEDDVIISASPEFLIIPFCRALGIDAVMASPVELSTGRYRGENCHGEEKVKRFFKVFPDGKIDEFYSDSYSDAPLAGLAAKAYLVKGDILKDWGEK